MSTEKVPFLLFLPIFSPSRDRVWTQMGYCDLKNLQRGISRHEQSITHIQSHIALKTLDRLGEGMWIHSTMKSLFGFPKLTSGGHVQVETSDVCTELHVQTTGHQLKRPVKLDF